MSDGQMKNGPRSGEMASGRSGTEVLSLLGAPLNVQVLRTLEQGPCELVDLRRAIGLPPQSTLRIYLKKLTTLGVIEAERLKQFPTSTRYSLTPAGGALLRVADILQAWLWAAPEQPIELGSTSARSVIKALVEGWSNNIVLALAVRPLALTDLNRLVPRVPYPSLERRLSAMRLVNLVEARRLTGRAKPYEVTEWLRRASQPIVAAIGWEHRFAPEATTRVGRLDVEAIFLLTIPLIDLAESATGRCRLAVEVTDGGSALLAGVTVDVKAGKVISCAAGLKGEAEAWALGKPLAWLRQLKGGLMRGLEVGGDADLAAAIFAGVQRTVSEPMELRSQPDVSHLPMHAES